MTQRVTQLAVEVVRRPVTANARATQVAVEVLRRPTTANARSSQLAVEVLRQNIASSTIVQPVIIVIAG